MTSETRLLIDPSDIVRLELECKHCNSRLSILPEKIDRLAAKCPNCNDEFFNSQSYEGAHFNKFLEALQMGRALRINAIVRLEIKQLASGKSEQVP